MGELNQALFFDVDTHTSEPVPTTYESMRKSILATHTILESVPDEIRQLLVIAIDYVALAYEQANAGRLPLYERLTNDAFTKAALALELTLKQWLGRGAGVSLKKLISEGIASGLLPSTDQYEALWEELRSSRNAIVHGDSDRPNYGLSTARFIRVVIDALNAMYANEPVESEVDT